MTTPANRSELHQALAHLVRGVGWSSERLGRSFASSQRLHPTDFRALAAIFEADAAGPPLTVRELAAELDLTSAAVTYAVDRLEGAGHIRRERGHRDRRTVVLRFAEHGRAVASEFFTPFGAVHAEALAGFTDEELATALRVLSAVHAALETYDADLRGRGASDADDEARS